MLRLEVEANAASLKEASKRSASDSHIGYLCDELTKLKLS